MGTIRFCFFFFFVTHFCKSFRSPETECVHVSYIPTYMYRMFICSFWRSLKNCPCEIVINFSFVNYFLLTNLYLCLITAIVIRFNTSNITKCHKRFIWSICVWGKKIFHRLFFGWKWLWIYLNRFRKFSDEQSLENDLVMTLTYNVVVVRLTSLTAGLSHNRLNLICYHPHYEFLEFQIGLFPNKCF